MLVRSIKDTDKGSVKFISSRQGKVKEYAKGLCIEDFGFYRDADCIRA